MLNFIVLGYVPGTSVQITFLHILVAACGIMLGLLAFLFAEKRMQQQVARQLSILLSAL